MYYNQKIDLFTLALCKSLSKGGGGGETPSKKDNHIIINLENGNYTCEKSFSDIASLDNPYIILHDVDEDKTSYPILSAFNTDNNGARTKLVIVYTDVNEDNSLIAISISISESGIVKN